MKEKFIQLFVVSIVVMLMVSLSEKSYSQSFPIMYLNGASYNAHDRPLRLETDENGKSYILGTFQSDQLQFGTTVLIHPQPGDQRMFLACIDNTGNWLWANADNIVYSIDDFYSYNEMAYALTIDSNKNIYIAGKHDVPTQGSLGAFPVSGNSMFVAKADSLGNWQWVTSTSIVPDDITVDNLGNVLIIGRPNQQYGTSQVLVSKINNTGSVLWTKSYPTANTWFRYGKIDTDSYENIIIRATFNDYIHFPSDTFSFATGSFLAKLDPSGNVIWAQAHSVVDESATTMQIDNDDNIVLAGNYNTQVLLDTITLSVTGNAGYLAKFNSSGGVVWAKTIAQSMKFFFTDMAIDPLNNIAIGGTVESIFINFYDTLVNSTAYKKAFVVSYDSSGNFRYVKHDLGSATVITTGVGVDANGKNYTTGLFHNPSFSIEGLTYNGYGTTANLYVYQITGCGISLQTNITSDVSCFGATDGEAEVIVSHGSPPYQYLWSDNASQTTQTATNLAYGEYTVTVTDNSGCIETATAFVDQPNFNDNIEICAVTVDSATAFNMVIWNKQPNAGIGNYYVFCESPVSGIYNLLHVAHVDSSNYFIDNTSNPSQKSYKYKVAVSDSICENISPNHSDPHKTIHLTANVGTGGENNLIWTHYEGLPTPSYYIYRSNNNGPFALLDVVTGTLTSYSDMTPPQGLNKYFISIDDVNCNTSKNLIQITSNRIQLGAASVEENADNDFFYMYPNPNDGSFSIQFSDLYVVSSIKVLNSLGATVFEISDFHGHSLNIDMKDVEAGIYYLSVCSENFSKKLKFIIQ